MRHAVSVIIPAYNEEHTILGVIRAVEAHPGVSEIIVVSDGSTDRTALFARQTSATVIDLEENVGKGTSVKIGVEQSVGDILVFLDADLIGMTPDVIERLIGPILRDEKDMMITARDQWFDFINFWHRAAVGGERALRRELWERIPERERQDFQMELALNFYALMDKRRIGTVAIPNLRHRYKIQKYGIIEGIKGERRLAASCINVIWTLYVRKPIVKMTENLPKHHGVMRTMKGYVPNRNLPGTIKKMAAPIRKFRKRI